MANTYSIVCRNALNSLRIPLLIILVSSLGTGCSNDSYEDPQQDLIGTWRLEEVYFDPGDGSGNFQPVDIEKLIEFKSDGTVRSDQNLCFAGNAGGSSSSGIFLLPDSILQIDGCPERPAPTRFSLKDESLVVSYPCIEACQEKYIKIE